MKSQKLNPLEVERTVQKALEALRTGTLEQYNLAATELVELIRVKNRNHWWELWKPRYRYPELEGGIEFRVTPVGSMATTGRVVKATSRPEYDPTNRPKGGRVTKAMPRQLRKIKEGQEAVSDE